MKRSLPGLNIQYPISDLILKGKKPIETRTYSIPEYYLGQEMLMIETPGKSKGFSARAVAILKFTDCFKYKSQAEFYADFKNHLVDKNSPWAWTAGKPKWGWSLEVIQVFKQPIEIKCRRGIVFTKNIEIDLP